jgi:hypothetical protein
MIGHYSTGTVLCKLIDVLGAAVYIPTYATDTDTDTFHVLILTLALTRPAPRSYI